MSQNSTFSLRVLLFKDLFDNEWVAQCLDTNSLGVGETIDDAILSYREHQRVQIEHHLESNTLSKIFSSPEVKEIAKWALGSQYEEKTTHNGCPIVGKVSYRIAYDEPREQLLTLLKNDAYSRSGDSEHYTLSSGEKSDTYIDARMVSLSSRGLPLIGEVFFNLIKDFAPDAVGGMATGAIPIVAAIVQHSCKEGKEIEGFYVRPEAKDHGRKNRIEGNIRVGGNVVIVDDVVTTGESIHQAIRDLKKSGYEISAVVSLIDRCKNTRELLKSEGVDEYASVFTLEDFQS